MGECWQWSTHLDEWLHAVPRIVPEGLGCSIDGLPPCPGLQYISNKDATVRDSLRNIIRRQSDPQHWVMDCVELVPASRGAKDTHVSQCKFTHCFEPEESVRTWSGGHDCTATHRPSTFSLASNPSTHNADSISGIAKSCSVSWKKNRYRGIAPICSPSSSSPVDRVQPTHSRQYLSIFRCPQLPVCVRRT